MSLAEFSLPKFYQLFGISKVKSAAVSAFRTSYRPGDRSFTMSPPEHEKMSLSSLETIVDALLEIMEVFSEHKNCLSCHLPDFIDKFYFHTNSYTYQIIHVCVHILYINLSLCGIIYVFKVQNIRGGINIFCSFQEDQQISKKMKDFKSNLVFNDIIIPGINERHSKL